MHIFYRDLSIPGILSYSLARQPARKGTVDNNSANITEAVTYFTIRATRDPHNAFPWRTTFSHRLRRSFRERIGRRRTVQYSATTFRVHTHNVTCIIWTSRYLLYCLCSLDSSYAANLTEPTTTVELSHRWFSRR